MDDLVKIERAVLGAIMVDTRLHSFVGQDDLIDNRDFTIYPHSIIWNALKGCKNSGRAINPLSVRDCLKYWNYDLSEVGGWQYLIDLAANAPRNIDLMPLIEKWSAMRPLSGADRWRQYRRYLESDAWKLLRRKVFDRCGGICEGCREQRVTQVHHLSYDNFGNEFLFELVGLCAACHERVHA